MTLERRIIDIAMEAGAIVMKYFKRDDLEVRYKLPEEQDGHVTIADKESDAFLRKRFSEEFPNDKLVTEETDSTMTDFSGRVWFIDPLDGTRVFACQKDGFSIILGLCVDGVPIQGVIYAPALDEVYFAEKGSGAYMEKAGVATPLAVSQIDSLGEARMALKLSNRDDHVWDRVQGLAVKTNAPLPGYGIALRVMKIAKGELDIHMDTALRTGKWDTCGPQVILEEAGGEVSDVYGNPLDYAAQSNQWMRSPFVATNGCLHRQVIADSARFLNL